MMGRARGSGVGTIRAEETEAIAVTTTTDNVWGPWDGSNSVQNEEQDDPRPEAECRKIHGTGSSRLSVI